MPARLSSEGLLLDYEIPDYRYYPTNLLATGTRDWSRVRFLQACERLEIPYEHWPDFGKLSLPPKVRVGKRPPVFTPPHFDPLREGIGEWRRKAEGLFRKHCDEFLTKVSEDLKGFVKSGVLTRIERSQGEAPPKLRFEWAARRYCLGERYKSMASAKYSDVAIRRTVSRMYALLDLKSVTKRGTAEPSHLDS